MEMRGTVKWFDVRKGYGFITDEEEMDYFVHYSEIQGAGFKKLRDGQEVSFVPGEDDRGRCLAREVLAVPVEESGNRAVTGSEGAVESEAEKLDGAKENLTGTPEQETEGQGEEMEGSESGKTKSARVRGSRTKTEETV